MEPAIYRYSKKQSIATVVIMLILGALFISNIYKAYNAGDRLNLMIFGVLVAFLACVLVILIFKRLMPALRGETILELNDAEIIDYLKNITINWSDVDSITMRRTRSALLVVLHLKWESDHGRDIAISLGWVEGDDKEIYQTFLTYLDRFSNR